MITLSPSFPSLCHQSTVEIHSSPGILPTWLSTLPPPRPYQIVADEKMPEGGEDEGEDFGSDREIGGEDDEREREKRSDDGSKLGERKKG